MCGIVGYVGRRPACTVVVDALRRMEYRGYDSAGIALLDGHGGLTVRRRAGRLANLDDALRGTDPAALAGHSGLGHTRWATHGRPSDRNAHPHRDATGQIAVVHNGIIENFAALRAELEADGVEFASDTDTERGVMPSALNLAADLGSTLDIIAGVRLGSGKISVHPNKLGLAGHGLGGSAAVLAAVDRAGNPGAAPTAVVAIFPTVTKPRAEELARALTIPGLVLAAPGDPVTLRSNAVELANAWDGAVLRTVRKAKAGGLPQGRRLARLVGLPGADRGTQKTVRALLTGYLLYHLTGDKTYRGFADPDAALPKTEAVDPDADPVKIEEKVVALLKP